MKKFLVSLFIFIFLCPDKLFAIQSHGGSEGIIVHQIGHIFFLLSLCALFYWLRGKWFLKEKSKFYFQLFGFFLIIWNLDVILMHFLDEQLEVISFVRRNFDFLVESTTGSRWLEYLYYFGKMDHFLCVPGLFFLYKGLTYMESEREDD